jgi:hypothetical protein
MTEDKVQWTACAAWRSGRGSRFTNHAGETPRAIDYGRWMIVDSRINGVLAGVRGTGRPELDLDDVEAYLTGEEAN